jgi:arabinose-5-phosphate isomerase
MLEQIRKGRQVTTKEAKNGALNVKDRATERLIFVNSPSDRHKKHRIQLILQIMNNEQLITLGRRTIELESVSVGGLLHFIDEHFCEAVRVVHGTKGRLVVSGIGKSAIIAQKMVATLNSTGTAALYMHAADAIHGDLGMVQQDDVVMIISKSGESPEIKVLVPLIKNFGNTIIGMVGNVQGFLAKHCDILLNTTVSQEACPNNLAPTSSTTAQMAMGDALAVCLMEWNGFTGQDFARFHPGGMLGKKLYLRVQDLYIDNQRPVVKPTAGLKEVILSISEGRLGMTVVEDEAEQILGVVTDGDLRRMLEKNDVLQHITAEAIMTRAPKTIEPEALAVNALEMLRKHNITQLVVASENRYLGVLHLHELVKEGLI